MALMFEVSYLPVIVAVVVSMVLGGLWYSPFVFAKKWMALIGKTEEQLKADNSAKGYIIATVAGLVTNYLLAVFILSTGSTTLVGGLLAGLLAGVAFVLLPMVVANTFEARPMMLTGINAGYNLILFTVNGAIIGLWQNAPF